MRVYDKFTGNAFITASNKDCPASPSYVKRGIGGVILFGIITHFLEVTPSIPAYRLPAGRQGEAGPLT